VQTYAHTHPAFPIDSSNREPLHRYPGGTEFTAAWQASRIVRDLGTSAPAEPEPVIPAA
jgi:hypothetical protein